MRSVFENMFMCKTYVLNLWKRSFGDIKCLLNKTNRLFKSKFTLWKMIQSEQEQTKTITNELYVTSLL